jgi:hypothetical protein
MIVDFPAIAILQRREILIALLNIIGSPYSQADVGELMSPYCKLRCITVSEYVELDRLGLHAVGAMLILQQLLSKAAQEVNLYFDTTLCVVHKSSDGESSFEPSLDKMVGLLLLTVTTPSHVSSDV